MLDRSNIEHIVVGLVIQAVCGLGFGSWGWGAVVATALFVGREQTQARPLALASGIKPNGWREEGLAFKYIDKMDLFPVPITTTLTYLIMEI